MRKTITTSILIAMLVLLMSSTASFALSGLFKPESPRTKTMQTRFYKGVKEADFIPLCVKYFETHGYTISLASKELGAIRAWKQDGSFDSAILFTSVDRLTAVVTTNETDKGLEVRLQYTIREYWASLGWINGHQIPKNPTLYTTFFSGINTAVKTAAKGAK